MTTKQLDIFLHLTETLNFTKTAEQMYLSQTTITFQIQNLEEELGVVLFDRSRRAIRLTPAGDTFKEYARRIISLMNQAVAKTEAVASGHTGLLQVGFSVDTNKAGLADLIRDFQTDYPYIQIRLQGGYPEALLRALLFDQLDLFVTPYSKNLESYDLNYYRIGRYKQVAAFHKDHDFVKKKFLKYRDFEGESLILVTNQNIELDFTEEFADKLREQEIVPGSTTKTDNIDTVFLMLDANMGVSVIPEYFTERLVGSSRIKLCRIDEDLNGTDLVAVWKSENKSEELVPFIRYLMSFFPEA